MNKEEALQSKIGNPDMLVVAGSRLYGTHDKDSDFDERGFTTPPFEYLLGLARFENTKHTMCVSDGSLPATDRIIFSIHKFFELLFKGDPVLLETLYSPPENVKNLSETGRAVMESRDLFLSKKFYHRIAGYAISEWRKVRGVSLEPIKRAKNESEIIESIRKMFRPEKESMDEIIKLLFLNHTKQEVIRTGDLGAKRKSQIREFGYCVSSASHCTRLLGQAIEFLETESMTFPRPNAKHLRNIKLGKIPYHEVQELCEDLSEQARCAFEKTDLPNDCRHNDLDRICIRLVNEKLRSDERFVEFNKNRTGKK